MQELPLSLEQRGHDYGVIHFLSPVSGNLLDILAKYLDADADQIEQWLHLGCLYVQGQRVCADCEIQEKTYVRVHSKPRRFPSNDHQWSQRVIFSNDNFAVINKPSALPCHSSVDNTRENVLAYLEEDLQQKFYITHRLDVPTNGLLVVAKTKNFQSAFNSLLKERGLRKKYRAVCTRQSPPLGLHSHYMEPSPRAPKKVHLETKPGFLNCELEILNIKASENDRYHIEINLLTGRTHQIRAQMAALGCPIQGDTLYGADPFYNEDRIDLTAYELSFVDPIDGTPHLFHL